MPQSASLPRAPSPDTIDGHLAGSPDAGFTPATSTVSTSSGAAPALRFDAIDKRFRGKKVLSNVSFDVGVGESVAIVGVNGAGKTTLLRCLLDFSCADSGAITIFGEPSHRPQARRRLAFLSDRFTPPGHMTGHEVLAWISALHGNRWSPAQSKHAFERLALPADAIRRAVRDYSKGMTQRLGLAAILMSNKAALVLDEPMSGLDPVARRFVAEVLQQARQAGASLLFTSHSLHDLDQHCDRMLIIDGGCVRYIGTPDNLRKLCQRPDLESAFLDCLARPCVDNPMFTPKVMTS